MKKILTVVLALLMMAVMATTVAADEPEGVVISFSEATVVDGVVTVDLVLEQNPGIYYLGITPMYDDAVFAWDYTTTANGELGFSLTSGLNLIFSASGANNITATGKLATLTFTLAENAPHADLALDLTSYIECYNAAEDDIPVTVNAGKVTIAHNVVHVEAVAATCMNEGNQEYWYCEDESCGLVCTDEAMTQVSNRMNVKIPVQDHTVVAVAAVEPGCHMTGNVAHWYCTVCDLVCTDEEMTQVSNHMSVVIPALGGETVHVEAKEATKEAEGNIEHWYCETCELVWIDEALTQISNHLSVITPKLPAYEYGDVDGDGSVDGLDYMLVKQHVLGTYELTEEEAGRADLDPDGVIDGLDYMRLKMYYLGTWTPEADEPADDDTTSDDTTSDDTTSDDTASEGDDTVSEGDDTVSEGDDTASEGDDTASEGEDSTSEPAAE